MVMIDAECKLLGDPVSRLLEYIITLKAILGLGPRLGREPVSITLSNLSYNHSDHSHSNKCW